MFIVLEGIDGSGKTTLQKNLMRHLQKIGREAVVTREPRSKEILMGVTGDKEKAFVFARDRYEHVYGPGGIAESLREGKDVICDRYVMSNFAYQGTSLQLNRYIENLNRPFPSPDCLLFLDVDFDRAIERIQARDNFLVGSSEIEALSGALIRYRQMLCSKYTSRSRYRLNGTRIYRLDANRSARSVSSQATSILMPHAVSSSFNGGGKIGICA